MCSGNFYPLVLQTAVSSQCLSYTHYHSKGSLGQNPRRTSLQVPGHCPCGYCLQQLRVWIGGFKFDLMFVDCATRYTWTFRLKSLQHIDIQAASLAFWDKAGSLARQFRCNCNEKFLGSTVCSFLPLNHSSIAASPAGRQSSNGLIESHWKIMVHTSRAYLTEKQMPRTFWYYAIKHSAQMMNMIPGKYWEN